MTTELLISAPPKPATVLRRVTGLDARDVAICKAVLRGARTIRDIAHEARLPSHSIAWGRINGVRRRCGGLALGGYITIGSVETQGVYRAGPQLAGIDSDGSLLELVEVEM